MKKSNITGWKDVFRFTLIQTLKSRAFIISNIIFIALAVISMPIIGKLTSSGSTSINGQSPVKKVYINNETTLSKLDFSGILKDERFSNITFETMKENFDTVSKRIETGEKNSVILTIKEEAGKYSLNFLRANSGPVNDSNLQILANAIAAQFETAKADALGISDGQMAVIHAPVKTSVITADANGVEVTRKDTSISPAEYGFVYGLLFIIMMANIMASTQIATSIVTEKSTRVIEYLLISVKPLAIMVGKIMAMLTAVLLQMVAMILVLFASNKISAALSSSNGQSVLSQYLPKHIFQNLSIINIVSCLILIILGMIFYATLAGLAGATVSRIEEVSEGLKLFTITNLIGVYMGIAAANFLMGRGINGFVIFTFLFPLSSPFILPGSILVGRVTLPIAAAAVALQILFIVLLFKFVARVYETLILNNGNKIKIKELVKLSKMV